MPDSLLPVNATSQERAIEASTARLSDVPVPVRDVWNPDTCPSAVLPWLAWQYSVDQWDATWSDDQKRGVIKASVSVHRHKGTIGAVRSVFTALGFGDVIIDEGRNNKKYDGSMRYDGFANYGDSAGWPYYRVRFSKALSTAQANQAIAMLANVAPLRSKLWALDFTDATLIYNGVAKYDGSYKYGAVVV